MDEQNRLIIFDTTLRDGEQSPGATLNLAEKLEIARQLARLGVDVIEAGFAIASPGDFEAVSRIAQEVGQLDHAPIIASLARAQKGDIDRAWGAVQSARRPRIHTFLATSDIHLEYKLKMSRGDFYRLLDHVRGAVLVSLDESRAGEDHQESATLADHLADPQAVDLEAQLEEQQTRFVLLRTLNLLPEQERLVVALYYYEHLTLKEIGRTLGISESRVSQVHTRAMSRLKLRMQKAATQRDEAA